MQHGPKRRRFRNPTCLAALALAVGLATLFLVASLIWSAATGPEAPSLLGLVRTCAQQPCDLPHSCNPAWASADVPQLPSLRLGAQHRRTSASSANSRCTARRYLNHAQLDSCLNSMSMDNSESRHDVDTINGLLSNSQMQQPCL